MQTHDFYERLLGKFVETNLTKTVRLAELHTNYAAMVGGLGGDGTQAWTHDVL